MAKRGDNDDDDKKRPTEPVDETEEEESASSTDASEEEDERDEDEDESDEDESDEDEDEKDEDESDEDEDEDEDEKDEPEPKAASEDESDEDESDEAGEPKAAAGDDEADDQEEDEAEGEEQGQLPAHLGAQKYVYSAFFTGSILFAYILGRTLDTIWVQLAAAEWAVDALPAIATVADDDKQTYSLIAAGLIALVVALRTFRKSSVRTWAEEVAAELVKVKWPTRKEVYGSTVVVLATSAIAVTYLFLLDRFWGFVTNLIYGTGT